MRVALYVRVSSSEQAIRGLSIEAQTNALHQWAENQRATVVGVYVDAGITARKKAAKRPALQRLLDDVRAGKIDLICFTKLDRWFRNIAEYYKVQEILEKYNVNWRTIREDYDTSTAAGRLKINIMLSIAQDEADRGGERIEAVFEDKLNRCEPISGKVPLGYAIENKKMVVVPEKAVIVQDIFKKYLALRSIRALRKYILDTHGILYCHTNIRNLLSNERYIGKAHDNCEFCPAIIERGLFQEVNELLKVRGQRNAIAGNIYLFTGMIFCEECGNRLSAHIVAGKYIYYRCTRYEKLHLCSHKKKTSELILEKWLLDNILRVIDEHNIAIEIEAKKERPVVDISKIKRKMEKLKDLYLSDMIDREMYEADYTALRKEIEASQVSEAPKPTIDAKMFSSILDCYNELTRKERKEFWGRIVRKIIITNTDDFFVELI